MSAFGLFLLRILNFLPIIAVIVLLASIPYALATLLFLRARKANGAVAFALGGTATAIGGLFLFSMFAGLGGYGLAALWLGLPAMPAGAIAGVVFWMLAPPSRGPFLQP